MIGTSIPGIPGTLLLYASICHQHRGQRNVYLMLPTYFCPHLGTLATPHSKHGQGKKILGLSAVELPASSALYRTSLFILVSS